MEETIKQHTRVSHTEDASRRKQEQQSTNLCENTEKIAQAAGDKNEPA